MRTPVHSTHRRTGSTGGARPRRGSPPRSGSTPGHLSGEWAGFKLRGDFVGTTCVTGAPLGLFDEECVEGATIVDANLSYRVPTTDATLQFAITNLFDTPYRSFVGVPEIGRMAMLSVRYNLF